MSIEQTNSMIPYGRQWIDEDDIQRVVDVLRSDFLTTGPAVNDFERAVAEAGGAKHAVVVNSGTAALHAAYFAMGLKAGDEIITSPLTFAATANAALYLGANVRFVDVERDTGNIDPERVEAAITPKTRLIVPVDYAGHPAEYDAINVIAARHGVRVVADAAHSFGATYKGRPVGSLADATETSFHPVKPFTTGEGGAVLTGDAEVARRVACFRTHGIVREPALLDNVEGPWSYEMHELGFNYRLTDLQCALGTGQIAKLGGFIDRRRAIASTYLDAFASLKEIILPTVRPEVEPGWHLFVVRVAGDPSRRLPFFLRLRELGLGVQVHYPPVHRHPYYQRNGYSDVQCPLAEEFYARAISLPIFPRMTDDDVRRVIDVVHQAIADVLR